MILPRSHIQDLYRFPPNTESQRSYLRLDKNERVIDIPEEIVKRFHELINGLAIMSYPEIEPLYQKLAEYIGMPRNYLLLTSGSDLAIKTVFETYVDPGDNVLLHMPSYAMYEVYSEMFQANLQTISFDRHLELDLDAFMNAITPQTRLVALENPNGFVGTVFSKSEIAAIAEKTHRCATILLIDEAYHLFTGESIQSLCQEFENIIIVRSFSKDIGMAGLRCGYLLSKPENIDFLYRVKPMYEVTEATVAFCMAVLEFPLHIKKYLADIEEGMTFLKESLHKMGIVTGGGNGNFIVINLGNDCDLLQIIKGLKDRGVLIRRPFSVESIKGWLRIGVGNVPQMKRFVLELGEVLAEAGWHNTS